MEATGSAATYDMLKSKRDALAKEAADLRRTYKPVLDEEKELSAAITTLKQVQQHAVDTDISTGPIQKKRVEFEGREEKDMVLRRAEGLGIKDVNDNISTLNIYALNIPNLKAAPGSIFIETRNQPSNLNNLTRAFS
jgi:hypothetical protein